LRGIHTHLGGAISRIYRMITVLERNRTMDGKKQGEFPDSKRVP
jgi:hypothetical protein